MTTIPDITTLSETSTLTDRALAASADRTLRAAQSMDRPYRLDDDLTVTWQGNRGVFTNLAYLLSTPDSLDDVLARISDVVPPGRPVSLIAAVDVPDLSTRGWHLVGHPPLMVRPAGPADQPMPAELTVTEVRNASSLEAFERTIIAAFPEPDLEPYSFGSVYDGRALGGNSRLFLGSVAGHPVATSAGHVAAGVNLVEMVSTDAAARGRGYGAALTVCASTIDPALSAVLITSDLGRPVYERMGFLAVTRWTIWHRPAVAGHANESSQSMRRWRAG